MEALIASLLTAVGGLIADALKGGDTELARTKLKYFTAHAKQLRDADRSEAERLLRSRFKGSADDPYDDDDVADSVTAD